MLMDIIIPLTPEGVLIVILISYVIGFRGGVRLSRRNRMD